MLMMNYYLPFQDYRLYGRIIDAKKITQKEADEIIDDYRAFMIENRMTSESPFTVKKGWAHCIDKFTMSHGSAYLFHTPEGTWYRLWISSR